MPVINDKKYYRTGDVLKLHPLLQSAGYYWLLENIKAGRIKAKNTSLTEDHPRYKIQGKEVKRIIKRLG